MSVYAAPSDLQTLCLRVVAGTISGFLGVVALVEVPPIRYHKYEVPITERKKPLSRSSAPGPAGPLIRYQEVLRKGTTSQVILYKPRRGYGTAFWRFGVDGGVVKIVFFSSFELCSVGCTCRGRSFSPATSEATDLSRCILENTRNRNTWGGVESRPTVRPLRLGVSFD